MDKFQEAFAKSRVLSNDEAVKAEVKKITDNASKYQTEDVYRFLFSSIDLTTLSSEDSQRSVAAFTQRVNDFDNDHPDIKNVAAICVYSNFAEVVKTTLDVAGVDIAVVAGGFPSSQTFTSVKVADVALAVADGATEVDVVINVGMLLDGNYEDLTDELIEMKHNARGAKMKVILETGALLNCEQIKKASVLALHSDADFLKTSTGKIYPGASLEAAWVMCQCIKEYHQQTGRKVGFKAAGGVRTPEDAVKYYAVVKEILGDEWLTHDLFRIGASSLANTILAKITGTDEKYF